MTTKSATRRARSPGEWLFLFLGLVFLAVTVVLLSGRSRDADALDALDALDTSDAVASAGIPDGVTDPGAGEDGDFPGPDAIDPARFEIVEDGVIEDTATGIQVKVADVKKGDKPLSLERLRKIYDLQDDLRSDLRDGRGARPARLRVESIDIDADVLPIGLDRNRALAVPRRADITGWWSGGYAPGEAGPTVIVGHYDSKKAPGVFAKLKDVAEGDTISIEQSDGSVFTYTIVLVERLHKTAFPTEKVYGKTELSTLRLVTCGGKFNRRTGHYEDNVIAYAELVSLSSAGSNLTTEQLNDMLSPAVGISPKPRFQPEVVGGISVLADQQSPSTTDLPGSGTESTGVAPSTPTALTSQPSTTVSSTTTATTSIPSAPSDPGASGASGETNGASPSSSIAPIPPVEPSVPVATGASPPVDVDVPGSPT